MRASLLLALPLLLALSACGSSSGAAQGDGGAPPRAPEGWQSIGDERVNGVATRVAIDPARTTRGGTRTARTVARYGYAPAQTDAASGATYDEQEFDREFDCARTMVRTLGSRMYSGGAQVARGGATNFGDELPADGLVEEELEEACRLAGITTN
jgi:hypothetical protein